MVAHANNISSVHSDKHTHSTTDTKNVFRLLNAKIVLFCCIIFSRYKVSCRLVIKVDGVYEIIVDGVFCALYLTIFILYVSIYAINTKIIFLEAKNTNILIFTLKVKEK